MDPAPPAPPRSSPAALWATLFGFAAVLVSQSISEGGTNSWTSLPAWAALGAMGLAATGLFAALPSLGATAAVAGLALLAAASSGAAEAMPGRPRGQGAGSPPGWAVRRAGP